jgi:hypothetical protein
MLKAFMNTLRGEHRPRTAKASRAYPRRAGDCCVALVNGKMHPVENWSIGGILFTADDRLFGLDDSCDVTLKFKLRDDLVDVTHSGKIIRKSDKKVALQFAPMTKKNQVLLLQVVDDFVSQRFADSQQI